MRDILHIGLHKTGTTYLQNVVWPQVRGVQYLTRPFTQFNHAFNMLQYADDALYEIQDVRAVLDSFSADRFLISDESLSGKPLLFGSVNRSLIAQRLQRLFPGATIILFIRDQKDIILSHYNSYVKEPTGTKNLRDLIWKPGRDYVYESGVREHELYDPTYLYFNTNDFFLHVDSFLYSRLIALYKGLFDRVEVFLFEDMVRRPAALHERLSDIVGQRLARDEDRWNRSYSRNELAIRRSLNRLRPLIDSDLLVKGLSRILGAVLPNGSKETWRREVEEIVGEYYREDNKRLKEMCPDLPWELYDSKYE